MKAEFTIDQIRTFVAKGHQSVSTRYVKSALQHLDDISQQSQPSVEEIYNIIEDNVWIHEDGVDEVNAYHEPSDIFRAAQAIHDLYTQGKEPNKCYSCKYEHDDNSHQCNKCDDSFCMWEPKQPVELPDEDQIHEAVQNANDFWKSNTGHVGYEYLIKGFKAALDYLTNKK